MKKTKHARRVPVRKLRLKFRSSHWGIISKVARQLGFSNSYVSMVAAGQRHNQAIYDALALAKSAEKAA